MPAQVTAVYLVAIANPANRAERIKQPSHRDSLQHMKA